jgi:hypothetical protein
MMMFGDPKKALTTILAKHKPDGSKEEVEANAEKDYDPKMEAFRSIAQDIHHGIESKSIAHTAKGIKALHDMINPDSDHEEEDEAVVE